MLASLRGTLPAPDMLEPAAWLAIGVILLTLVGVAFGRYPVFRMNRATIAVVGATALVALGALSLEQAYRAIDLDTLVLLFAMMVLNANLRLAGFFDLVATRLVAVARSARQLLALFVVVAGALSALFLNDTIVLVFTPLALEVTAAVGLNPIPYLVAVATAANIGSVATVIGNPQNMLIGISSGIPFPRFTAALAPVAVGGLAIAWAVIALVYRRDLPAGPLPARPPARRRRPLQPLLRKGLLASSLLAVALLAGVPPALAALGAASLLLLTRRLKPERVFREIDWSLLVFFAGLFVVTAAVEVVGMSAALLAGLAPLGAERLAGLTVIGAVLSNVVSNVPAVLLLRPLVAGLGDAESGWLTLAMATTLAGNLTLLGSVANLIVAEVARRRHVTLSFWAYLRAGAPITLLSLAWGAAWLSW